MNMKTGEHGLHAVELTILNPENPVPWKFLALIDFGPQDYVTEPSVVQILDQTKVRQLRDELSGLLVE